ncbi:hypothetical protein [Streptomyces milbemycinicus]|uniref:Uncharacterized protein n=1 Tax=Streptomyces milbemycinicus TaxID=476552 RepID=A0ABW8LGK0_9ACTN
MAAAKAAAVARIGSAESSGAAAVQTAVSGARSRVRAQAAAARAQVAAAHAATVAGMQTATTGAQTAMDNDSRASDQSVTAKQNDRLTALGELYTRTEQRMREAATHAGTLAIGEGNRRAEQYRAKMIHRDDNWWDGPLTDNRCKAQANAATSVGEAYRDELPKAVDEPIGDMNNARPEAEKTVRSVADDVRKTLDTVLKQSGKSLTEAHTQTLRGAEDAKRAALQGISQAVAAAEASLTQLQTSQTAAIRAQAAQQRQATERSATAAAAAIGKGVATARAGLDRGLKEFLRILGQDEVPDPEQLEEVLRGTGAQLDEQLENSAKGLRRQADRAATGLATTAERAAQGMSSTARAASGTAQQTASSAGQTLSRTASQTANGLRQVQQSYAETARAVQTGHQGAGRQVLEGLDKAYTELAGKFQQGADQQVKAVAEGLNKAVTQDIHPKIDEEAKKARDKVKPRWHTVLTILVVIVVVVALSIALGPMVIGAVTAGAAALGAGATAAGVIGVVVGGAIVGAAAGAVGQVVSNVLNGQPLLDGVVKAAIFGAVGGAVGGGASATVARTALSTGARVGVEMAVEVVTEVGLGALDAMISGQAYTWNDVLLGVVTTVAVTGVMAHPRVEAMTARVQASVAGGLRNLGIKVPELAGAVDTPDVDTPAAPRVDAPDAPSPTRPDASSPTPDSGGGPAGTPQPGRGPGGATSWDVSDIDPATGGAGSADGPVRPRDQDAAAAELRGALGSLGDRVDVTIDPDLPGRTVRVHYDIGEDGLITNVRMAAGPSATPTDIRLHAPTARTMLRYGGLSGRVRQLLRQVTDWVGIHGPPPVGTRAWEARLELRKLPNIIADRARAYADADPAARAELEAELASLIAQVDAHAATLKEWNLDPGRGYVAADDSPLPPEIPKTPEIAQIPESSRKILQDLRNAGLDIPPVLREHPSILRSIADDLQAMVGLRDLVENGRDLPGFIDENPYSLWVISQHPGALGEFFKLVNSGRSLPEVVTSNKDLWELIASRPGAPYQLCRLVNDGFELPPALTRNLDLFRMVAADPEAMEGLFRLLRRSTDSLDEVTQYRLISALEKHGSSIFPLFYGADSGVNRLNTESMKALVRALNRFPVGMDGLPRVLNLIARGDVKSQLPGALGEIRIADRLQQQIPDGYTVSMGNLIHGAGAGDLVVKNQSGDVVQIVEVKSYDWTRYTPSEQRGKAENFAEQRSKMIDRYAQYLGLPRADVEAMYTMVIIGVDLPPALLSSLAQHGIYPDQDLGGVPSRLPVRDP